MLELPAMRISGWTIAIVLACVVDARAQAGDVAPAKSPVIDDVPGHAKVCVPDCRGGYTCIDGACVSACNPPCAGDETCVGRGICERRDRGDRVVVVPASAPLPAPAIVLPPSPSANSNVAFHVNLLGLLQLGPTAALELGGKSASLSFRFRALNAGALSYVLIADASEGDVLGFSYGLSVALRIYSGGRGNMRGFFWGPGVEYASTRVEEDESVAYNTQVVIPEFELGYRWVFDSFLVDVGGGFGHTIIVDATSELLSENGTTYPNDAEGQPYALGTVSVGAFF